MKYAYPVKNMCRWLVVSASGFFDWKRREVSATARRREELTALVVEIFTDSDETYGYRRVHAELGRRRISAGLELVRFTVEHIVATARAQLGLAHDTDTPGVTLETSGTEA